MILFVGYSLFTPECYISIDPLAIAESLVSGDKLSFTVKERKSASLVPSRIKGSR